jgi:ABC-type multidrug transport system permease subunit
MSKRRQLGSVYTTFPAKSLNEWLGRSIFKMVASLVICILWTGVYYVLLGVVNFNKNNFLAGAKQTTVDELFQTTASKWVLGIGMIVLIIYVFRSKIGEKVRHDKRK